MVRANLHIICGNCGSNEDLSCKVERGGQDMGTHSEDAVYVTCGNCSTVHDIFTTVEKKKHFPKYIMAGTVALEWDDGREEYYRHAGRWSTKAKWKDGELILTADFIDKDCKIRKCTEEEWRADNKGYV